ncbi:unnamed protein product [Schistosoma rodhaini]|nr:unnamed protein product [Schistosoma rodhaini]
MGKNKKKQSETIPLVPTPQRKRARRNKNKKLKKNLQGTNLIISNMPSIKVNESKKSKKRRFLKEQQQNASVLTKSNVKTTDKKQVSFGEASSESDAEPIEADWGSASDHSDNDDEQWQSKEKVAKSFTNSNDDDDDDDDEQSDSESSDNDLEQSEEDEDEELSEDELNTLIQSQKKPITKDTSKQNVSSPTKKPLKRTHESVENTSTSPKKMKLAGESKQSIAKPLDKGDNQASVSYSWANESAIIEEIKKRTIELSSATLYVSPLPSDCNESMLKSLSPSMVSYRFSTRKNKKIRGFVFLQYIDADAAEAARKAISGRLFAGNTITAQPNRLSFPISELMSDHIDRTQLFVTGFNSSTTKNDLMHIFPKGNIDFPLTKDGIPCGYAIVKFVNQNVSIEAFATTHKRLVRGLPIFVNFIFKKASLSKETDHKQNNKNQSEVNKNQSSEVKEKKLNNKPSPSSGKSSNVTIQKTTVDKKDIGSNKGSSNTKVLVQQLPESEADSQSSADSESNDESKTDELLVHQTKNKNSTTGKTSVLNDLVSSKMSAKNKTKAELSKLTDDGDDDEEEDDDEEDDDDDDDEDDEDEISEYDEDDSGSEEEEDDDDDDDDEEDEEDLGDTDSDDASEDNDEVVNKNVIKKDCKQKKLVNNNSSALKNNSLITSLSSSVDEEQASSASSNNSSDEEIDKQLQAVIQAKRNSKKSFKSPNSAKRNSNFNAKKGNNEVSNSAKNPGKNSKPHWLRVPETKKTKKK